MLQAFDINNFVGISNPAKTDSGIYAANEPKPKSTASKNKP
jgi:hypothetical protein